MLITKELKVKVADKTSLYYKALGYSCHKGDEIIVPIENVHPNCREKIEYECDLCHKPQTIEYKNLVKYHDLNKPLYCVKCANLIRINGLTDQVIQYVNSVPKEGYRFCKKCLRELPLDVVYFNRDKACDGGLRYVCRECCGKPFKTHDDNWCADWSDEDISLLKENYASFTGKELQEKFFPNRTIRAIECAGAKYGIVKNDKAKSKANIIRAEASRAFNTGRALTDEAKRKLSVKAKERCEKFGAPTKGLKWSDESRQRLSDAKRAIGKWSGDDNPRHANPLCGEDNPNWKGGATSLYQELRSDTRDWFVESGKLSDFKCIVSGEHLDNVHHLTPFRDIVNEVFDVLNLDYRKSIADYSIEEENSIRSLLKELHLQYGLGAGLNKDVHKLFHDNYGYFNSTKDDFKSFIMGVRNGVYDDYFTEHHLSVQLNENALKILLS